jgi:hypothetical protein
MGLKPLSLAAQTVVIYGFVYDEERNERLPGAYVFFKTTRVGVQTDGDGYFSLKVNNVADTLVVQYLGYKPFQLPLVDRQGGQLNVYLKPQVILSKDEIEVTASSMEMGRTELSTIRFSPAQITQIPSFLGQRDILKSIQYLPGVQAGNEGTAQVYVRGGSHDQTLILVDGAPVFNAFHSSGFISAIHPGILNTSTFISGSFHPKYGGRLGAVLDLGLKEGHQEQYHGEINYGLLSADILAEGPIKKGKSSLIVAARTSTRPEALNRQSVHEQERFVPITSFYDVSAKFTGRLSDADKISISMFLSNDESVNNYVIEGMDYQRKPKPVYYNLTSSDAVGWTSALLTLQHRVQISPAKVFKWGSYYTQYATHQKEGFHNIEREIESAELISDYAASAANEGMIVQGAVYADYVHVLNPQWNLETGSKISSSFFKTNQSAAVADAFSTQQPTEPKLSENDFRTYEAESYGSLSKKTAQTALNIGLRNHIFKQGQETLIRFQPRVMFSYDVTSTISLKTSYAYMHQFLHLLTNGGIGVNTERWIPTNSHTKPESGYTIVGGFQKTWAHLHLALTTEVYYRQMREQISYKQGASLFRDSGSWEDQITLGAGEAYGLEFFLHRYQGRLKGAISYTLSKSTRTFDELNRGKPFYFKYHRLHNLSSFLSYTLMKDVALNGAFVLFNGSRLTTPASLFAQDIYDPFLVNPMLEAVLHHYPERNNYELPRYQRLDISLSSKITMYRQLKANVQVGIYNVLNRYNAVFGRYENTVQGEGIRHISMYPRLPFISAGVAF